MSPIAKKEYKDVLIKRYKYAVKRAKIRILDEYCSNLGHHRKHAIRIINKINCNKPKRKPGRPSKYNHPDVLKPLKKIWLTANQPCSKRLKEMLPEWIKFMNLDNSTETLLLNISASSIDRLLKPIRPKYGKRGLSGTKSGSLLRKSIPISVDQWDKSEPGFMECDTVHHCGTSLRGHYAVSLVMTDIATGWTECRAVYSMGHKNIVNQIKHIEQHLPFKLKGFDSDCGHEFINHRLINYLRNRVNPVQFTRSRPYHKNDNAHIEQKNWTHVRQWIGYDRLNDPSSAKDMNDLYCHALNTFNNFFLPSTKLIDKERVKSKTIRKHDKPRTPYQRLLDSKHIDLETKDQLRQQYAQLNPFTLRLMIERKLKKTLSKRKKDATNVASIKSIG